MFCSERLFLSDVEMSLSLSSLLLCCRELESERAAERKVITPTHPDLTRAARQQLQLSFPSTPPEGS